MSKQRKTVFVVGAGASAEFGLPTGAELKTRICDVLDIRSPNRIDVRRPLNNVGKAQIKDALQKLASKDENYKSGDYEKACDDIIKSMPLATSIDNYIHSRSDNRRIRECGKLAIACTIASCEKESHLFKALMEENRLSFAHQNVRDTWIVKYIQQLCENANLDIVQQRLSETFFVIFNYDRCVEFALVNALKVFFDIQYERAVELVQSATFFHPYGTIGNLFDLGERDAIEFGPKFGPDELLRSMNSIKTFTEGVDSKQFLTKYKELLRDAEILVFLGFSFNPLNMKIFESNQLYTQKIILATTKGLSLSDVLDINITLAKIIKTNGTHDLKIGKLLSCNELFNEHWRLLSYK